MPIELIVIGAEREQDILRAISLANQLQDEFDYVRLPGTEELRFSMLQFDTILAPDFLDSVERLRTELRGFHPFMIAIVDAPVDGKDFTNLFCSSRGAAGLGVLTSSKVPDVIVPRSAMTGYFLYYLANFAHSYIAPEHKNHDEPSPNGCIYDRKIRKTDLLKSMRAGAFCNDCRTQLVSGDRALSARQFEALESLFAECGKIVRGVDQTAPARERVFIGSSSEGLGVARKLQASLATDYAVEIWNQGTVFGLGTATLEALEEAVDLYDYGIFVFTPDDELLTRGDAKPVARDNVVFEMGLFAGKLGRRRAFVVSPSGDHVSLPSDLAGITVASYDAETSNLAAAVEPACERIRDAITRANQGLQRTPARVRSAGAAET